jgi:hypothetical protein
MFVMRCSQYLFVDMSNATKRVSEKNVHVAMNMRKIGAWHARLGVACPEQPYPIRLRNIHKCSLNGLTNWKLLE